MSDQKRLTKGEKLRQWAEKLLSKTNETELKFRAEDMEKLIRELQSFSSDLELKNEELARIRSELEETLEKYVDLYDFSPVGYFTVTETGSIVEVNLTGARLLGVERTQLCKRIFSEFMPPDFRVAFGEHCREILKYGEKREIEIKLVRQDKTSFDASIESIPVPGFRIRCAISDISDRKRGEESLRYLASYPEMNPNPIMEVNLAGNLHYLNPAAKELFPNLTTSGIQHPSLAGLESFAADLKEKIKGSLRREVKIGDFWYEQAFSQVPRVDRIRIYSRDITERKESELLNESLNDINLIINSTLDLDEIMNIVVKEGCKALGAETAAISLRKGTHWIVSYVHGFPDEIVGTTMVDEEEPHALLSIKTKQPVIIDDALDDERVNREHMQKYNVRSVMVIPLTIKEKVIGVLFLNYHSAPVTFTNVQIDFARKIGHSLGLALENARLFDELRKSRDELEIRVQERTAELMETVEELQDETSERKRAEEALIEQSRILEGFFTSTITPLVFLDRDFNFIRVNEAYAKACQREVSDFPGHNHFEFYPSDAKAKFEQVVETKRPYRAIAKPFAFPDHPEWGETYWNWILTPILNDAGDVEFLVFSLEDVTERKRAEEAVKAERQRFNDVLEMLPAYLVLLTSDYHVPFANRFFRERFGESHGRRCFEYLFGRREPCEICDTYSVLKTMAPHEWEWTGPDGRKYAVFDFPFTDTNGSTLILEMGIDVTERKRAEETLKMTSLYARSLIEASLDPLVTISRDGKVMDVNRATEHVTGAAREKLIGSDFSDYFTEPEKAREGYQKVFSKETVRDYPLAILHASGKTTDVLYNATVFRNEAGEIQGVFATARDVTELKAVQKRIEATNMLLDLFVKKLTRKEYLDSVIELVQHWSGCRCVGIRVLDEKNYIPYESYLGFSQEFWESENCLSVEYDRCACIRVVTGNPDSQDKPVMTPAGSFRCENTFEFLGNLSEDEKARFRGICIQNGFKSVAIIPIRYREKILGAIHLADEGESKVPINNVEFIEFMAPLIGEAINRFNLEEELKDSEKRLRHLSSQLLTVQENERKRISREIHDSLGQSLSAIKFKVAGITQQMHQSRRKKIAESLGSILPIIQISIEESRRIQMDLRPSVLDDLGIIATLNWFSREFQQTYPAIRIEKENDIEENEVPDTLKTVIYRISQEGLNNIAKHSKADLVRLFLKKKGNRIELIIEDNGKGFDLDKILSLERSKRGLGLTSMQERAELSGGTFEMESILGKGTTIKATWPF